MSEYISVACILGAIVLIVIILAWALWPPSFQQKAVWNPKTQSWYHLPDHDEVFPMMTPIDEEGRAEAKEKYRRFRRRGWIK